MVSGGVSPACSPWRTLAVIGGRDRACAPPPRSLHWEKGGGFRRPDDEDAEAQDRQHATGPRLVVLARGGCPAAELSADPLGGLAGRPRPPAGGIGGLVRPVPRPPVAARGHGGPGADLGREPRARPLGPAAGRPRAAPAPGPGPARLGRAGRGAGRLPRRGRDPGEIAGDLPDLWEAQDMLVDALGGGAPARLRA